MTKDLPKDYFEQFYNDEILLFDEFINILQNFDKFCINENYLLEKTLCPIYSFLICEKLFKISKIPSDKLFEKFSKYDIRHKIITLTKNHITFVKEIVTDFKYLFLSPLEISKL